MNGLLVTDADGVLIRRAEYARFTDGAITSKGGLTVFRRPLC